MKYTVTMEVTYRKVVTVDSISKPYAERDAKTVIHERFHDMLKENEILKSIEILNNSEVK
jgi:hypothetical protein|tara:strand:- start:1995 stop:2174 length:180 start_codon:yes stop_codon:yes gene_type:complete